MYPTSSIIVGGAGLYLASASFSQTFQISDAAGYSVKYFATLRSIPKPGQRFDELFESASDYPMNGDHNTIIISSQIATLEDMCDDGALGQYNAGSVCAMYRTLKHYLISYLAKTNIVERALIPVAENEEQEEEFRSVLGFTQPTFHY